MIRIAINRSYGEHYDYRNEWLPICDYCADEIGWYGREGDDHMHDKCREQQ